MFKRVIAMFVAVAMILALATACKPKTTTSAGATGTASKTSAKAATSASAAKASASAASSEAPAVQTDLTGATIDPNMTAAPTVTAEPPPAETINPNVDATTAPDYVRPAEPAIDLQGRTVHFKGHYLYLNQYVVTPTGDPSNAADKMYNDIQSIQDRFNFKFAFEPVISSGWRVIDAFNVQASAGADWADIVWNMSRMAFPVQVVRNLVVPIDTVFDFQNDPVYNARYMRTAAEWEGRVYGLGSWPIQMPDLGMFYNEDIIKAMGMTDPIDLYNQGNWTWETFFDMAVQATRDFDNDGVIDQYGLNGDVRRIYQGLLTSNGNDIVDYMGNGEYQLAVEKPSALKALIKVNDVINVLKITKPETFMTADADPSWLAGKALFLFAGLPGHIATMRSAAIKNVRWMSLPRGPDAGNTNLNMIRESNYYAWTTTIGDDWKDVVRASSWLFTNYDWIRYPDRISKEKIYDKQTWINGVLPQGLYDLKDLEHIGNLMFDQGTVVIKWPAWATITTKLVDTVMKEIYNGVPVVTALDAHRDELINEMNATLNYWQ